MNFHLRIRRWVIWWLFVGVVCGAIALAIIMGHQLTSMQDRILLLVGVAHWLLGGIVCWAFESVKFEAPPESQSLPTVRTLRENMPETEWHAPSEFLLPGRRKSLLPWRH